ncbi:MAG: nucleotidyltransferase domain-containing protein [Bacteroidales bacterium]|nr:nucleotidyltransferase domain-containing protein [Bacteroidales bacterium]
MYDNSFSLILDSLRKFTEIEKAILFGSRAMGNYKKGSDIDIAITGKNISDKTVTRLSSILNQELPIPYYIDVADYNSLSNIELKEHIQKEEKIIYQK